MLVKNFSGWNLKSIFFPPSFILRQFGSILFFKHLIKWKRFNRWLFNYGINMLPVAAGAIGMGCIGFPAHPAWEITTACNLNCIHCHTNGGKSSDDEISTKEAKKLIDELSKVKNFRMLVYTGGEPLVRDDLFEILDYSKRAGFVNVIATNGTLITRDTAAKLKKAGVAGVAISLDSHNCEIHNNIRKNDNSFEMALRGVRAVKEAGILLQINTTAMGYNFDNLSNLIDFSDELGAGIMLMYQLVPIGRGIDIKKAALDTEYNQKLLTFLSQKQKNSLTIIEPVAGPQYWPYILNKKEKNSNFSLFLAKKVFYGCTAGSGLVYIKANGDIWPCPFVEIKAGNIRRKSFIDVWKNSEVFQKLRDRENNLKGKCGKCVYISICGGCRGRAMVYSGDYLEEDVSCFI